MSNYFPLASDRGMSSSIPLTVPEPEVPDEGAEPSDDESMPAAVYTKSTSSTEGAKGRHVAKSRKKWWIIGAIIALLVIAGLVLYPMLTKPATDNAPTTRTRDYTVATTTMQTTVSATGTIQPAQRADLSFTSAGTVVTVNVVVGDAVTAGQALAAIDTTDLQSAVDQAQSAVTAAKDDYNTAVSSGDSKKINAAKSTLTAKQNALDNAKTALANATLTAPFDGTVAIVNVHVGDKVSASSGSGGTGGSGGSGQGGAGNNTNVIAGANANSASSSAAITIITADTYQVTTSVGSADVTSVKKGQDCTITPDSSKTTLKGTVASVGVIATSSTSAGATFPVVIDITGQQQGLFAGVGASVEIVTSSRDVLAVPTAAITREGGTEHVQVKTGSGITDTVIKTGATSGGLTEVTSGLKLGDVVVITFTVQTGSSSQPGGFSTMFPGGGRGNGQGPGGGFNGPVSGGRVTDAGPGGNGGQPGGRQTP